jgi:hypothetical protein
MTRLRSLESLPQPPGYSSGKEKRKQPLAGPQLCSRYSLELRRGLPLRRARQDKGLGGPGMWSAGRMGMTMAVT